MTGEKPTARPIAYNVLGVDSDTHRPIVVFMDDLLELEEDLMELESDVAEYILDPTGYSAQEELSEFECRFSDLAQNVHNAKNAIFAQNPNEWDRYSDTYRATTSSQQFVPLIGRFIEKISELEELAFRISQQIQSKRSSANSRLIATLSGVAVGVSTVTLVVSTLGFA